MLLRRFAALILLFSVFAIVRPVLACETMDAHRVTTMKAATPGMGSLADAFPSPLTDEENPNSETPIEDQGDESHSDLSLEEIADLSCEFHFFSALKTVFPLSEDTADSLSFAPLLRPPAAA